MGTRTASGGARRLARVIAKRPSRSRPSAGTTAFVLSGGASLGAAQIGMLRALYERGIAADLLVGSSAGALNAAFVASRPPEPETADDLARVWRTLRRPDVFPLRPSQVMRALRGRADHLVHASRLGELIDRHLEFERIEQAPIPLHLVAVDALSGDEVRLSSGPAREAVLASAAVPAVFPAVRLGDRELVDGGVANHTPISHAVELGATTIYVLPTGEPGRRPEVRPRGALAALLGATGLMMQRRLAADVVAYAREVELIVMPAPRTSVAPSDFSRADVLIAESLAAGRAMLAEREALAAAA